MEMWHHLWNLLEVVDTVHQKEEKEREREKEKNIEFIWNMH